MQPERSLASDEGDETVRGDETLGPGARPESAPDGVLLPGATRGRYIVMAPIGRGGMGQVHAAYDPELDRKVALKVLHPSVSADRQHVAQERLYREARALARVSHPNVVTVFDVGVQDDGVWLTMEHLEGITLSEWMAQGPHPWSTVVEVFVPIALGLAAAHELGLVHRDIKPANVMIGADGTPRVMDFGLARGDVLTEVSESRQQAQAWMDPSEESLRDLERASAGDLTRTGAVVGTPSFMAPEQFVQRGPIDARADQFSYCVVLWEALYGERPFAGSTLREIAANVVTGTRRDRPSKRGIPRWLRAVVERGLQRLPDERWPSMTALVQALERGRRRARVAKAAQLLVVAAGAAGVGLGWKAVAQERRIQACNEQGSAIEAVWNAERADRVRTAILATELSFAGTVSDKVDPWLDAHAADWARARVQVCRHGSVERTWDAATVDRAAACLRERRDRFDAFVSRLETPDKAILNRSVHVAASLGPVDRCTDAERLRRQPIVAAQQRAQVERLRSALADLVMMRAMGDVGGAETAARATLAEAEALGWPPLEAEARAQLGLALSELGSLEEAAETLEAAYFDAIAVDALEPAILAAHELILVEGEGRSRFEAARGWARHAALARQRLGGNDPLSEADEWSRLGIVEFRAGNYEAATSLQTRVLSQLEAELGPRHPRLLTALNNLAIIHGTGRDYDRALAFMTRALALADQAYGAHHPQLAELHNNIGLAHVGTGEPELALEAYARALEVNEQAYGVGHPNAVQTLNNLALAHSKLGNPEAAEALLDRGLEILRRVGREDAPPAAALLDNLGSVHNTTGRDAEAVELHHRALAIRLETLGPTHPEVGVSRFNLGRVLNKLGRVDEAFEQYQEARAIWTQAFGDSNAHVAYADSQLAELELAQGRATEALARAERAVEMFDASPARDFHMDADVRRALVDALLATRPDDGRLPTLLAEVRDRYAKAGPRFAADVESAEALLREVSRR